ncbi:hypothetical protein [Chryseobacterium foetidum]|uniref:hypothetical protein n=1 Tax=Chryseobacterium foetidum TaxID=2951057 RepID=UPI0021C76117|nr:hypothetical protein [Chryseobacterium foetidum]
MKSLYIIAFLALGLNIYAQENKKSGENLTQEAESYKESKAFEAKMMQEAKDNQNKKPSVTLASEQGLSEKQKSAPTETVQNNSGKMVPGDASLEEILASIPGRKARRSEFKSTSASSSNGVVMTAEMTVYDIKKTIPKK